MTMDTTATNRDDTKRIRFTRGQEEAFDTTKAGVSRTAGFLHNLRTIDGRRQHEIPSVT